MRRRCLCECHKAGALGVDPREPIESLAACSQCDSFHLLALIAPRPLELPDRTKPWSNGDPPDTE